MFNKKSGITLVALVVTIIILLILAGVSINMIFGNDEIFSKTQMAVEKYQNAQEQENYILAQTQEMINNRDTVTIDKKEYDDLLKRVETLENNINDLKNRETVVLYDDGKITQASSSKAYDLNDSIENYTFIIVESIGGADANTWRCSDIFSVKEIINSDEYYTLCCKFSDRWCRLSFNKNEFYANNINNQYPIRILGIKI